ncbi:MAG: hypothetical protein IT494_08860 [Gammaproteobacteria bacterium]|nr:hypothetical protein [Gammaproteobacteria bacterium]
MARKNAALEERGVPTVGIVFNAFEMDFNSSARSVGVLHLPHVVAPRAYASLPPEEVKADVAKRLDEIIARLTTPLPKVEPGVLVEKITTQAGHQAPWGTVELGPIDQPSIRFTGTDYAAVHDQFQQKFLDWGWGDGMPLIPPTKERVEAMLMGTSRSPDTVLTNALLPARGIATVRLVAVQAVMAGARPEHFSVILAATQAMANVGPDFIIIAQTTSPMTPLFWVNGPIVREAGINSGMGSLGPGTQSRANIAIGRTARLVMMNIGGAYLGTKDMDTIGAADKFSLVTAEDDEELADLGWQPYHVSKGFKATDSTITIVNVVDHGHVAGMGTPEAEGVLLEIADDISKVGGVGGFERMSGGIVMLSGDTSRILTRAGFTTKESIGNYIASHIHGHKETYLKWYGHERGKSAYVETELARFDEDGVIRGVSPQNITVLRVGAHAGKDEFYRHGNYATTVNIADWK